MGVFSGRGIIVCETFVGESDKLLTILLKEKGKIVVSAKGARKTSSKFLAGAQLFTYADFVFHVGKGFTTVSEIDIIETFYGVRCDYDSFCNGCYFVEICQKFILQDENCDETIKLLLKTLSVMKANKTDVNLVFGVFLLKFLQINGFAPNVDATDIYVCFDEKKINVAADTILAINYVLNANLQHLFHFNADQNTISELKMVAETISNCYIDINIKSRKLL